MGHKVERVWHPVLPMDRHQRTDHCGLHSRIYQRQGQGGKRVFFVEHTYGRITQQTGRGGASAVLLSLEGDTVECMVSLDFPTTNNEVEYEVLIAGLNLAKATAAASVVIYCNYQVVTNQVNGVYECKAKRMKRYLDQVRQRVDDLTAKIIQIPKGENEQADRLA